MAIFNTQGLVQGLQNLQNQLPQQPDVSTAGSVPYNVQNPQYDLGTQSAQMGSGPMQNIVNQSQGLYGSLLNQPGFFNTPMGGQGLQFLTQQAPYAGSNPYLQSYMKAAADPLIEQYQEQILPSLGDSASMAGQYGSSRQGIAEGIATKGLLDDISRQNTGLAQAGYTSGLEAMMGGLGLGLRGDIAQQQQLGNMLGMAPEMAALGLMPSQALGQIGQQRQGQVQNLINDMMGRYNFYQQAPQQNLQNYASLIQGLNPGGGTTTATTPTSQGGLAGMLGGALGGAQMGSDLFNVFSGLFGGGGNTFGSSMLG